jgi:hypothetical protein
MTRRLRMLIGTLIVTLAAYAAEGRWMPDRFEVSRWKTARKPPATEYGNDPRTRCFTWVGSSPEAGRIHVRMCAGLWYYLPKSVQWWSLEVTAEMDNRCETVWRHDYNDPAHVIQIAGPGRFHNGLDVLLPIYVEPGMYRVQVELREAVPELDPDGYAVVFSRATGPIVVK